ncbi:MAG TPA: UDP-glucose 4-epimerase GalE [Sphingomicrobium sp.]|nr:UDP-glucose 4-epimerase GalE [Sphingomicrobium sp.]
MIATTSTPARHVLVLGGAGYIGSHAVLALKGAGYRVSVVDDLSTGFRSAVPAHVRFHQGDIGDLAFIEEVFGSEKIDAIMHFAGSLIVPESVTHPLKYYHNNSCKTHGLIGASLTAGIEHFVFSSTAAVYGTPDTVPISESAPTRPINPYGSSKLIIEWMLRDVAAVHPLRFAALRYFNVAGADSSGRAGQSTAGATHLIKVAAEHVVGRRPSVQIFGSDFATPDGTGVRDYIHVSDLADVHVRALDYLMDGGESLIANCGYGHGFSVKEVLRVTERVAGQPLIAEMVDRRAGDPAMLVADPALIKSRLGWQARYDDLETIVRHALEWERSLSGGASEHHSQTQIHQT